MHINMSTYFDKMYWVKLELIVLYVLWQVDAIATDKFHMDTLIKIILWISDNMNWYYFHFSFFNKYFDFSDLTRKGWIVDIWRPVSILFSEFRDSKKDTLSWSSWRIHVDFISSFYHNFLLIRWIFLLFGGVCPFCRKQEKRKSRAGEFCMST